MVQLISEVSLHFSRLFPWRGDDWNSVYPAVFQALEFKVGGKTQVHFQVKEPLVKAKAERTINLFVYTWFARSLLHT